MTRAAKPPPAITLADFELHCRRLRKLGATRVRHATPAGEFECDFMSGNERDREAHIGFGLDVPPEDE